MIKSYKSGIVFLLLIVSVLAGCSNNLQIYKSGIVYQTSDSILIARPVSAIMTDDGKGGMAKDIASTQKIEKYMDNFIGNNVFINYKTYSLDKLLQEIIDSLINESNATIAKQKSLDGVAVRTEITNIMKRNNTNYLAVFSMHGEKEQTGTDYDYANFYLIVFEASTKSIIFFGEYKQRNVDMNEKWNLENPMSKLFNEFLKTTKQ